MRRLWEIDALRGLMLVLMTLTHLPTRLTDPMGQPFGFVSAAEGFVLLSAFVAGLVYSRVDAREGSEAMRRAFLRRSFKVYLGQVATLIFLFTVIRAIAVHIDQPAAKDLMSFYLANPVEGLAFALLLVYEPALLDILPMYVLFMLLSPWVMGFALRCGWAPVILASLALWSVAQWGASQMLHQFAVRHWGLQVPLQDTGAFNALAWQLLWFVGLWMGASRNAPQARPWRPPFWITAMAAFIALYGFCWRHYGVDGQAAFGANEQLNLLFDKWQLGPLRLLDLLALVVLSIRFGPGLVARLPRLPALEAMGAASLAVFCAHLVAVLLVLAIYGDDQLARPWWGDAILLMAVFGWLYAVACVTRWRADRKLLSSA